MEDAGIINDTEVLSSNIDKKLIVILLHVGDHLKRTMFLDGAVR